MNFYCLRTALNAATNILLTAVFFNWAVNNTAQKMKFSIKDFFSKCDQIRSSLRIWSDLLNKFLMENFIFCAA